MPNIFDNPISWEPMDWGSTGFAHMVTTATQAIPTQGTPEPQPAYPIDPPVFTTIDEAANLMKQSWQAMQGAHKMDIPKETDRLLPKDQWRYLSAQDAAMRLAHTFIKFDGQPFYVDTVESDRLYLHDYFGKSFSTNMNDERVDIVPVPVGYFQPNGGGMCLYPMRAPIRAQKQGLDPRRLDYYQANKNSFIGLRIDPSIIAGMIKSMRRKYEPRKDVLSNEGVLSFEFAIAKTHDKSVRTLHHKNHAVAYFIPSERLFMFSKHGLTPTREDKLQKLVYDTGVDYAFREFS